MYNNPYREKNIQSGGKTMQIKKRYIGTQETQKGTIQYYMIQKDTYYGVELLEGQYPNTISTMEWFSDDVTDAQTFVELLYRNSASSIHLGELIDDYII